MDDLHNIRDYLPVPIEGGGYLIPRYAYRPRPGIVGWFLRLINREGGWEQVDLHKELLADIATPKTSMPSSGEA